ncbi:unnamed protein product [Urochloa decumbens]|uniref:Small auxin up regulated protein n=1 Tax=Urochloa decumbens TaxID=240449 RepID=A0ABC8XY52_9POAL
MAKMMRRKTATTKAAAAPSAARDVRGDDGKFPRGYVPVRLVAGDSGEEHERVLVPVALLNEPRMAELLEMAERRFGYGQPGVLRIPCDAQRFQRLIMGLPCVAT